MSLRAPETGREDAPDADGAGRQRARLVVLHGRPDAFVDKTRPILARLGYAIVSPDEATALHRADPCARGDVPQPEMLVVDELNLPDVEGVDCPIVLLTGSEGLRCRDPRIVAALRRPAGLHDLFRILQAVFEDTPRSTPRVDTSLPVVCDRDGRRWAGELRSLSENGGLLRQPETLPLGSRFALSLELPASGPVSLAAEAAYQIVPDLGVVFSGIDAGTREAIGRYVGELLLAGPSLAGPPLAGPPLAGPP